MKPGTVSKILWHFTGGPYWDDELHSQKGDIKSEKLAFEILIKILQSRLLKLSSYSESISIIFPKLREYDSKSGKYVIKKNVKKEIESSKVVCLADIPIQHIEYHSKRYGKFAIGFHRDSAIKNKFNPVFYTLNNSELINSIYKGFLTLDDFNFDNLEYTLDELKSDLKEQIDDPDNSDISFKMWEIENGFDDLETINERFRQSLEDFAALIKTFNVNEFDSIYCEREWRALNQFNFEFNDISMIILPKTGGYFDNLVSCDLVPKNIPIIPWEDLIEH